MSNLAQIWKAGWTSTRCILTKPHRSDKLNNVDSDCLIYEFNTKKNPKQMNPKPRVPMHDVCNEYSNSGRTHAQLFFRNGRTHSWVHANFCNVGISPSLHPYRFVSVHEVQGPSRGLPTTCICIRCRDVTFSGYVHLQNVSEDQSKLPLKWLLGCCYLDVKFETNLKGWMDKYKMYTYEDTVYSIVRRKRWYHCHSNGHLTPECDVQTGFVWPKATSMECSNSPTGRYSPIAWTRRI
jgi:hypothetical protein